MDNIKERKNALERAYYNYFVEWLERNGYDQAAEQFDKEFCDED